LREIAVTTTEPLHVLIAGGGLSGLALAQGLRKDGHTCEVFERDADDSRKIGYYLHMNADGGEALRRCLPEDLFELSAETSRRTYDRRESIVLDDQLHELSSQPHLGPPNEGERPHTGVHRRTLRSILRARLGDSFHPGQAVVGYDETPTGVSVTWWAPTASGRRCAGSGCPAPPSSTPACAGSASSAVPR
jgi:2-polyprenyl-6-methoxyphenol hydroxylase-like FAD-dependent oxidoreductase